jgi:hypothetical protein
MISANDVGSTSTEETEASAGGGGLGAQYLRYPPNGPGCDKLRYLLTDQNQLCIHDVGDAFHEVRRRPEVDGNEHRPREQAAPERNDPFRPILGPDDDLVVRANSGFGEPACEGPRGVPQFEVRELPHPVPIVMNDEHVLARGEVLEKVEEGAPAHLDE